MFYLEIYANKTKLKEMTQFYDMNLHTDEICVHNIKIVLMEIWLYGTKLKEKYNSFLNMNLHTEKIYLQGWKNSFNWKLKFKGPN